MAVFEIPLAGYPEIFTIPLGGIEYQITMQYRKGWFMDIADSSGNTVISAIPLVTDVDLLAQYRYLGIAGELYVSNVSGTDDPPTFTNLGTDVILAYVS